MARKGAITRIEDVETWFRSQKEYRWTLYLGPASTPSKRINSNLKESEYDNVEDSWEFLKETLTSQTVNGGLFNLFVPNNEKGNSGYNTLIDIESKNSVAGIAGTSSGVAGLPAGMSLADYVAKEKRMWDLEAKIEKLTEENESDRVGGMSKTDRMMDWVLENDAEDVGVLIDKVGDRIERWMFMRKAKSRVGVAGFSDGNEAVKEIPEVNNNASTKTDFDPVRANAALKKIQTVFPRMNDFLDTLAQFVTTDEDLAIQFFELQEKKFSDGK